MNYPYKYILAFILFLLVTVNLPAQQSSAVTDTKFKKYVVDETGTLTADQINTLNDKLYKFDQETTNQIIVYMISTLGNESLEDVSVRLAEKNKIGKKDRNNGVLFLIVKDDRKLRFEVGYGLEGVLTDALSSQIIRKEVTPSFKAGNYYEGIVNGVNSVVSVTKDEYKADPKNSKGTNSIPSVIIIILVFGFIFLSIVIGIIRRIFGIGRRFYTGGRSGGFWGGTGGFFGGSGGSGWGGGSGGFGGGGGFSGGGGSFGGGGASGSW